MVGYCPLCGQPLMATSPRVRHPLWPEGRSQRVCWVCFRSNPRCLVCGLPLSLALTPAPGAEGLCPTCAEGLPRCLACGRAIPGRYLEVNGTGPYCRDCYAERPPCDVCGAPLGETGWQLSDGRLSCGRCHATAVYDPAEAGGVYDSVSQSAQALVGLTLHVPTGLALVDRNQLVEIMRLQDGAGQHDPARTLGVYARRGIRRGIYVQTGLPRLLLLQVAAHEFGHAWQGENCPLLTNPLWREGFAEWLAYKLLEARGLQREMGLMLRRADLYGQGLRWVMAVEARAGVPGVLDGCRAAD